MTADSLAPAPSRSASWSRHFGAFAILLAIIAALFQRYELLAPPEFVAALLAATACAALALLLAVRAFAIIWRSGKGGLADASLGALYGAALTGSVFLFYAVMIHTPRVSDVATQGLPLAFPVQAGRPAWANPLDLSTARPLPIGRPLVSDLDTVRLFAVVETLARAQGWVIVHAKAPATKKDSGVLVAEDSSPVLRLKADIVLRVSPEKAQARVDMRSVSRFGAYDFGDNAARIDMFMIALRQKLVMQ